MHARRSILTLALCAITTAGAVVVSEAPALAINRVNCDSGSGFLRITYNPRLPGGHPDVCLANAGTYQPVAEDAHWISTIHSGNNAGYIISGEWPFGRKQRFGKGMVFSFNGDAGVVPEIHID